MEIRDAKPVGLTADGIDYLRAGSLVWGADLYGSSPDVWVCIECAALVLAPDAHSAWHRDH